jgi:CubicO group peptidase (beta-lactamase class C family)
MKHYFGTYDTLTLKDDISSIPQTDGFYQYERDKSVYPAYHFRMSAHDMALYGTLYLNNGNWHGRQIIPSEWIQASTRSYSVTNAYMDIGYGMLWNVLNKNEKRSSSSFYHTGTGIHMLGVYPAPKLVFVHRVDTEHEYNFPQENLYKIISLVFAAQKTGEIRD